MAVSGISSACRHAAQASGCRAHHSAVLGSAVAPGSVSRFALNVPISSLPPVSAAEPKTQHRVRAGDRPVRLNIGAHIDFFAAHGCVFCRKISHRSVTATRSLGSSIFAIHSRNSRREKFAGQLSSGKCRSRRNSSQNRLCNEGQPRRGQVGDTGSTRMPGRQKSAFTGYILSSGVCIDDLDSVMKFIPRELRTRLLRRRVDRQANNHARASHFNGAGSLANSRAGACLSKDPPWPSEYAGSWSLPSLE